MSLPPIVYSDEANEVWEELLTYMGDRGYAVEVTLKTGEVIEARLGAIGNFGNGRVRLGAVERDAGGMPVIVIQRTPDYVETRDGIVERLDPEDIEKMEVC